MDLNLKTKTVGATPPWLDSTEGVRFLVGGVTIDSEKVEAVDGVKLVKSGTPIKQDGTKWVPDYEDVVDGETTTDASPTAILWEDLDVTGGDRHGGAIDHGRVRTAALPVAPDPGAVKSLQTVGITFR